MSTCPITGDAIVHHRDGELHWVRADPEIHVTADLFVNADERELTFLTAKYELGEWCPHQPRTWHARLREQP